MDRLVDISPCDAYPGWVCEKLGSLDEDRGSTSTRLRWINHNSAELAAIGMSDTLLSKASIPLVSMTIHRSCRDRAVSEREERSELRTFYLRGLECLRSSLTAGTKML